MHATDLTPAGRFWFNAQVRSATAQFKKKKQEEARNNADSPGTADPQQRRELHQRQEDRAKTRESMQQAGMHAPSPDGQLSTLDQVRQDEQQAESLLDDDTDGSDQSGGRF